MESLLTTFLTDLQAIALDPRKRLFAGYLVAAVLIGVVWLRVRHGLGPLAALRRRLPLRLWRRVHGGLALAIGLGTVIHALQIEGTMEAVSKALLAALVLGVTGWVLLRLRVFAGRGRPAG